MRLPKMKKLSHCCAVMACSLLSVSCDRLSERMEVTDTREISPHAPNLQPETGSDGRFMPALRALGLVEEPAQPTGADLRQLLTWTAPAGWEEHEGHSSGMRLIDFHFGENHEGECYVSIMPGAAGGLEANLNRWRAQMGQPPYTADEISALPKKPFFNREGVFVAYDGEYKNVGETEARKDYRLVGLVHAAPQATIFVKMTGPKALVEQNTAAFDQFCLSIQPKAP
jgi:hypothetical protein